MLSKVNNVWKLFIMELRRADSFTSSERDWRRAGEIFERSSNHVLNFKHSNSFNSRKPRQERVDGIVFILKNLRISELAYGI
jgi:hypothetical protein